MTLDLRRRIAARAVAGDDGTVRCFLAIETPEEVRKFLVRVQEALKRAEADVKWVEPENLHLTLKFLGEVTEERQAELQRLLEGEAARWPFMNLTYAGIGVFPEHGLPRVVWAGATGDLEKLSGLQAAIERAAERIGVPPEGRPFVAHLTLGRVRSGRNVRRLQGAIADERQVPLGKVEVREFLLYHSRLSSEGPTYEALGRIALGTGGMARGPSRSE